MSATTVPMATAAERVQPVLAAQIARLRAILESYADRSPLPGLVPPPVVREASPVDRLVASLGLSAFESDVLLLAVAVELDGEVASLVARLQGGGDPRPTFGLALAALPEPHWDALSPARPLRHHRLVTLGPGPTLVTRPVSVDEHVLHALVGLDTGDEALGVLARSLPSIALTPTQARVADELVAAVDAVDGPVLVRLDGDDPEARLGVAQRLAQALGRTALVLRDESLDAIGPEGGATAALVDREVLLHDRVPVLASDRMVDLLHSPVVVVTSEGKGVVGRTLVRATVRRPDVEEQRVLWRGVAAHTASAASDDPIGVVADELAQHYRLPAGTVHGIVAEWAARGPDVAPAQAADRLRLLARERARVGLDGLAQRINALATWDDLVLPEGQVLLLRDVARQVRHRHMVHGEWGFAERNNRGLGVSALFTGESGTGKTMAAEVIARDLGLDLYRIDLSAVVSKYIGETEKNLGRLFDAAEAGGAVLLFDEADALFGRRSEVRDSHDRYANLEVAYLLQRIEIYRGLAILTTNLRANVDPAFVRRLRFIVPFPFPDESLREQIWRRVFPPQTPVDGLDPAVLAHLQVAGGSIHAIALGAAFAAADAGTPVRTEHVLHAARVEYAKADRSLTDTETRGMGGTP